MCFSGSQILRFAPLITGDTSSGSGWINTPWRLPFRELKHGTYLICRRSHTCGFLSTLPLQEKSKWRGKSQVRACLQVLARAREHACAKPCDFFFLKTVLPWKKFFFCRCKLRSQELQNFLNNPASRPTPGRELGARRWPNVSFFPPEKWNTRGI